ncbi:MAG: hypothetical protein WCI92_06940 [Bacteroidota bacterium]
MKKKIALTQENFEQRINAGKEKLMAKKDKAIKAAEKKFTKGLKILEDKFKVKKKKVKEPIEQKVKEPIEQKVKEPKAKKAEEPKAKKVKTVVNKKVKMDNMEVLQVNKDGELTGE